MTHPQHNQTPTRDQVHAELYTRSLARFIRGTNGDGSNGAWAIIEPGTPLEWNWHLDAICDHLEAVSRGDIRRLLITIGPRLLKSVTVDVMYAAWEWAQRPQTRFMYGSYHEKLVLRDAVKARRIMQSEWYQRYWPGKVQMLDDANQQAFYINTAGGARWSTTVGGGATGEGCHIMIADDPMKADDADNQNKRREVSKWWRETMASRLNDQRTGRRVVVMQRLHAEDLAADCIAAGYVHLNLPLEYDPDTHCQTSYTRRDTGELVVFDDPRTQPGELLSPRIGPAEVEELRDPDKGLGVRPFNTQYNQRTSPDDSQAIFPEHPPEDTGGEDYIGWQYWTGLPRDMETGKLLRPDDAVTSWDLPFRGRKVKERGDGPAFAVGQLWYQYGARRYLIAETRGQWGFSRAKLEFRNFLQMIDTQLPFNARRNLVEVKANGPALIDELKDDFPGIVGFNPDKYGDKEARAWAIQPQHQAGNLYLPDPTRDGYGWVRAYVAELREFPTGKYADRVDTTTQAVLAMGRKKRWTAI